MSDLVLTILALALVLLSALGTRLTIDAAALLAVTLLMLGGVLTPAEAMSGFGNPTVMIVACMFVLAEALNRTGAAHGLGDLVEHMGKRGPRRLLLVLLPVVMLLSGVMSNTAVVVLLLPILVSASQRMGVSPSRLLLPLSYASILGGTLTLVGTTTTLLVDGLLRQSGLPGFSMFSLAPVAGVCAGIGLVWLVAAGPWLLRDRVGFATAIDPGTSREFFTEIVLSPRSPLVGKCLADVPSFSRAVRVLQLLRGEEMRWPPFQNVVLEPDDVLFVKGEPARILPLLKAHRAPTRTASAASEEGVPQDRVGRIQLALAEAMVAPGSRIDGQTVREARLRERLGVLVLAVGRRGEHLRQELGSIRLRMGDVLLIEAPPEQLDRLDHGDHELIRLGSTPPTPPDRGRAPWAMGIALVALGAAALGLLPLLVCVLGAALLLVGTRCISTTQAYRGVNLRILIILGCMLALGTAVQKVGLAADIAEGLIAAGANWGHVGVLAALYLATMILTELVTNAATAGVMVPIALSTADQLGTSPMPFAVGVALAASCSFLTPVGYQTNLLVQGPGGYRLQDYLRLGVPLALICWLTAVLVIPWVFPF